MEKPSFEHAATHVAEADGRYDKEAYFFLRDVVDLAADIARQKNDGELRHVRGPEILEAFRQLGVARFGPMAKMVFNEWQVQTCEDVGEMVFALINASIFGKSDDDCIEDFKAVYSFEDAFVTPFQPKSKR
jgi:uncharacterized repeat protein (TIGR04138 family)